LTGVSLAGDERQHFTCSAFRDIGEQAAGHVGDLIQVRWSPWLSGRLRLTLGDNLTAAHAAAIPR